MSTATAASFRNAGTAGGWSAWPERTPADGKPVRWDAVDIYRVTDGKISEEWAADDVAAIMAQIGAFNPPWAA